MIIGNFGEIGELIFDIEIISNDGDSYPIEVLLDTGFTNGWLALDIQDAESIGWPLIERNNIMQMARGEALFNIYEGLEIFFTFSISIFFAMILLLFQIGTVD
ncbi:hypothetical protein [Nodularia spumigena]|jgi:predicted aspartyl protease|uniref:hypothetical protein n=1 Tax=Nodularia spumigena TaxID=70799 RepID=UPI002B20E889|nr:hypothetical protein [Nodularia spumigena]MEA5555542.1 hypothetical protein [Nodularia spumigena CH309]